MVSKHQASVPLKRERRGSELKQISSDAAANRSSVETF